MGMQGDFFQLLKEQGYQFGNPVAAAAGMEVPTATTILALKYRDGVLVASKKWASLKSVELTILYQLREPGAQCHKLPQTQ